jgi:hypothetical protein
MLSAVALPDERTLEEAGQLSTRADIIARYRHLRAITKHHHTKTFQYVSTSAMLQQARRLGLSDGRRLFLDSVEVFDLVSDLIVYAAPMGRSRALDRYARSLPAPAGSDEALMLDAMSNARFSILEMQRRHPAAGLILRDDARNEEIWLVDEGYELWMEEGMLVATRYYTPGPFSMTAGVSIPVDGPLITATVDCVAHLLRKGLAQLYDDPRFAEALYRSAVAGGVMERVRYRDPPAEGYAAA